EAGLALKEGRIDAVFTVAPPASGLLPDLYGRLSRALGTPPSFLRIAEAKAIAQRISVVETGEIVRGVLGGAPPGPT
ncbi:hypothetical protein, partial [Enterococcus faecium]